MPDQEVSTLGGVRLTPALRSRVAKLVIGLVAAGVIFAAVRIALGRRDELSRALPLFKHLRWQFVGLALAAEFGSLAALSRLQRRLLWAGGVAIGLRPLTGIALAIRSIQNSLPVGAAWSILYAFRQYRRRGADPLLAGWTPIATTLIATATLIAIAIVGLIISTDPASQRNFGWAIMGIAVVISGLLVTVRRLLRAEEEPGAIVRVLAWSKHLIHRPRGEPATIVRNGWVRLRAVRPSSSGWIVAAGWGLTSSILDLSCLALAFVAVGAHIPWRGLPLAYGASQFAVYVPVTFGGLGFVEGILIFALVFYGGDQEATVAAVLLYRVISFWLVLPAGWLCALALRRGPGGKAGQAREENVGA